jgi:RNA polymerase sigma-70 factor (ECF subfamily)
MVERPLLRVLRSDSSVTDKPALERDDADAIFRRYARYVASIALRLSGRDDEVDDTVQEVFLQALRGLHEIRGEEATRGWLRLVTVRIVRRRLRRRRLLRFVGLDESPSFEDVPTRGASSEDLVVLRRVYTVLDSLPADLRIAWLLRHGEEERLEDIASACECSLATVKRRIGAAQEQLERRLQ